MFLHENAAPHYQGTNIFYRFEKGKESGFIICETYRKACQKRGLLENDEHWDMAMSKGHSTAKRLRHLFSILLTTCAVSNPKQLWEKYKKDLNEDILRRVRRENPTMQIEYTTEIYNMALILLEDQCLSMAGRGLDKCGMPTPQRNENNNLSKEIQREMNYNTNEMEAYVAAKEPLLNKDQREAYNKVMKMIRAGNGGLCFLDAPGGKTFLINLLLATVRKEKKMAVAVVSSGIASTLLEGGRTVHSSFKLPLNLAKEEYPVCNITKRSGMAKVLQECKVIVWDECTMSHKRVLEAINRTLQDIRENQSLMGGTVVLLAGDFRQTLPVIPRSTPADELNACLKVSHLWRHVKKMSLTRNMRVYLQRQDGQGEFSVKLLELGNGKIPAEKETGMIEFPKKFCNVVRTEEELAENVFPNIVENYRNHEWLSERAILASKNQSVNEINEKILKLLPGEIKRYKSIDTVTEVEQAVVYPIEFLNSMEPPGFPPHNLHLKKRAPIMLLRNLDPPKLCNGTRLCIKNLYAHIIEATILTGCTKGEDIYIPRIPLIPNEMSFEFKRLQYPIRLAFAMSINKAQGQTLAVADINLKEPCFSHGQLYVACSRVGNPKNFYIYAKKGKTKNIVYQKAIN